MANKQTGSQVRHIIIVFDNINGSEDHKFNYLLLQ